MNAIAAFLLGLAVFTYADDSESVDSFDWDSDDTNSDGSGSDTSYNGMVIRVFQENEESPTIALGTSLDDLANIYCLKFLGFFESEDYDTSLLSEDVPYTKVAGSEVTLDDAQCDIKEVTDSTFKIHCMDVAGGYLSLTFEFTQDTDGDYGLEYTVILGDYVWTSQDSAAKLVMVQSVMECSEALSSNSTETNTDTNGEDTLRRLLQTPTEEAEDSEDDTEDTDEDDEETEGDSEDDDEDDEEGSGSESEEGSNSDSADESAGISSDDSGEFDEGNARFVLSGQAFDQCDVAVNDETDTAVASKLVYQSAEQELHIVFDHFTCDLYQDPRFVIDESKVLGEEEGGDDSDNSGVERVQGVMAVIVGCVMAWLM